MDNFRKLRAYMAKLETLNVPSYAASASFFIILSVFPAMILLLSLLQYTPLTANDLLEALRAYLPEVLLPIVEYTTKALYTTSSGTVISISAVTIIWSASRGLYGVMAGLNSVYHVRESRNYLVKRLFCMLGMLFLLLSIILMLLVHVFGTRILLFVQAHYPAIAPVLLAIKRLRFLFSISLLTLLFTALFLVLPGKRPRLRYALPGALLAAIGWIGFSALFSLYVNYSIKYSALYGSLTIIVLTMLWLYICMSILFYGGVLNYQLFCIDAQKGKD